tara:strand:+ start:486 stop:926 length:441 start_codon:yes stop_codon:yes gene_type:complete
MSGFKTWNNKNSNNIIISNAEAKEQWNETPTHLSTEKNVQTSLDIYCRRLYQSSDILLKNNITDLSNDKNKHLDKLKELIPKSYNFENVSQSSFGLIAQEVEKIYPNLVTSNADGIKTIDYTQLIPLLLLQSNNLERKIEELKNNN